MKAKKAQKAENERHMSTQYILKTQAVTEVMQRTGAGRFIVEKRMAEMESSGQIRFTDDPRDSRKKLISKEDVEQVVRALTPA
jgi:transposase